MEKANNYRDHLSAEVMMAYHRNELNPGEMHAVERHLLDCALCADAFEGYEMMDGAESIAQDLSEINERIDARVNNASRKYGFSFYAIAATLVMLLVATFVLLNVNKDIIEANDLAQKEPQEEVKEEQSETTKYAEPEDTVKRTVEQASKESQVALAEPKPVKPKIRRKASAPTNSSQMTAQVQAARTTQIPIDNQPSQTGESDQLEIDSDFSGEQAGFEDAEALESDDVLFESEAEEDFDRVEQAFYNNEQVMEEIMTEVSERAQRRLQDSDVLTNVKSEFSKSDVSLRDIEGVVTDDLDNVIPGINVILEGTTNGTTTDIDGKYKLQIPSGTQTLRFSFIGLRSEEVVVNDEQVSADVQMTNDVSELSEVVVTAQGIEREKRALGYAVTTVDSDNVTEPRPTKGWRRYKKYLAKALQYPDSARNNAIEGKVVVTFYVEPDGQLNYMTVQKGLGYGCDEEALRLIENGPQWIPGRVDGETTQLKATVRVKFEL